MQFQLAEPCGTGPANGKRGFTPFPIQMYRKNTKILFFTRFDLKSILNSHINLNNQLSGIFWTFLWPSRQFSKILTSMRGVCGPQKGVNLGQNGCFLSILKERKGTIDFKTWIPDLIAYYQPCLNQISTFQNYRSHCGGSVGHKRGSVLIQVSVFHRFWKLPINLYLNNWPIAILLTLSRLSQQFSELGQN